MSMWKCERPRNSRVILLLLIASMTVTSGCLTKGVIQRYGKACEKFKITGPVYGDTALLYVQGERIRWKDWVPRQYVISSQVSAYIIYADGKWSRPQKGDIPPAALGYQKIPEIEPLDIYKTSPSPELDTFMQSDQDSGFCKRMGYIYFKNSAPNANHKVFFVPSPIGWHYRPLRGYIYFPFVFAGAVVADIITSPVQILFYHAFYGLH